MRLHSLALLPVLGLAGNAMAQNSLLFAIESDEFTLTGGGGLVAAGTLRPDEVAIVTPFAGSYSASTFLGVSAQWVYLGDADEDGRLVDASSDAPGADTDAVFVKNATGRPFLPQLPRDVYVSKEGEDGFGPEAKDGDVFRYGTMGNREVFISEQQLAVAIGQGPNGALDLDAICQSRGGDLFVSFSDSESVGGRTVLDGGIVRIPNAAITYDANGDVTAVTPNSAMEVASEADVTAMVSASGMRTSVGGTPSTSSSFELSGLALDPAGGTWRSPRTGVDLPNLLFAWFGFSNDGAVLTTNGGGGIGRLNGRALASRQATLGTQIGLAPDSTGLNGLAGIAVVRAQSAPLVVENYPTNLITSSSILWTRKEVSGATPAAIVAFLVGVGPVKTGGVVPSAFLPFGEIFAPFTATVIGLSTADANGHAGFSIVMPRNAVGSGINLVFQAVDTTMLRLSAPSGIQFL